MTNRDFLNAVLNANINVEVNDFATAELAKLDKRNEKRRNTPTKEQKENEERKAVILDAVKGGAHLASEIATVCGFSTQRVSALCRQLTDKGELKADSVKVKGKGEVKSYSLVETDEVDEVEENENEGE